MINAIYLPAAFIAGAFFSTESFPQVLQWLADVLPLSHFIAAVRDVVIDDEQAWSETGNLAIVAAWGLVGAFVAARRFRWEPRER